MQKKTTDIYGEKLGEVKLLPASVSKTALWGPVKVVTVHVKVVNAPAAVGVAPVMPVLIV